MSLHVGLSRPHCGVVHAHCHRDGVRKVRYKLGAATTAVHTENGLGAPEPMSRPGKEAGSLSDHPSWALHRLGPHHTHVGVNSFIAASLNVNPWSGIDLSCRSTESRWLLPPVCGWTGSNHPVGTTHHHSPDHIGSNHPVGTTHHHSPDHTPAETIPHCSVAVPTSHSLPPPPLLGRSMVLPSRRGKVTPSGAGCLVLCLATHTALYQGHLTHRLNPTPQRPRQGRSTATIQHPLSVVPREGPTLR